SIELRNVLDAATKECMNGKRTAVSIEESPDGNEECSLQGVSHRVPREGLLIDAHKHGSIVRCDVIDALPEIERVRSGGHFFSKVCVQACDNFWHMTPNY